MEYVKTTLQNSLVTDGIYTVHYYEYMKNFKYRGERHAFWELVYADRKSFIVTAGDNEFILEQGQAYLHVPDEFHSIRCDNSPANSVVISFDSASQELYSIAGRIITCGGEERRLIGGIIKEAGDLFSTPLNIVNTTIYEKSDSYAFGAQQLIRIYLEQLLILLVRGSNMPVVFSRGETGTLFDDICAYLEKNVENRLKFSDIQREFNVSASVIKRLFGRNTGGGVMEYFNRLKIESAKQMIRENNFNFTEIAQRLSFNTSQYFTTVFRRVSGMTPSEYADSVTSNYEGGDN